MKKIIFLVFIVLSNILLNAQEGGECFTPPDDTERRVQGISNYVYDPDGPVKTIRVNFYYLLKDDGTGNFNETSDNYTNLPYNGYLYAEDMVKWCNNHWNQNILLTHMPYPPVPALPKKIQYQLCGVFFHKNTTDYDHFVYNKLPIWPSFIENSGEVINIYITKKFGGGVAGNCSSQQTLIGNAYERYKMSIDENNTWQHSYVYKLINHEVGHLFGLGHVIQNCCKSSTPSANCSQGCADNPTYWELLSWGYTKEQICAWNDIMGSNNCALFINAEEVTIDGEFEVQLGSILNIEIVPSCD